MFSEKMKLQVLEELMEELKGDMHHDKSDFDERLGRKKPEIEIEVMEIGGKNPEMLEEEDEEDPIGSKIRKMMASK